MSKKNQILLLDHFNNPEKKNEYSIKIKVPEFTCLCPKTGQPDFATLYIDYVPKDRLLVYQVKEGWGPICNLLNVPIPNKPSIFFLSINNLLL